MIIGQTDKGGFFKVRSAEVDPPGDQADVPAFTRIYEPAERRRPPETRAAITHKFCVGGFGGYLTVGLYDDGVPCEIFIKLGKVGSTLQGFADGFATAISIMIQHGIPLRMALEKHVGSRFEPSGVVAGGGEASSILDYVARWMLGRYCVEWAQEQGR